MDRVDARGDGIISDPGLLKIALRDQCARAHPDTTPGQLGMRGVGRAGFADGHGDLNGFS